MAAKERLTGAIILVALIVLVVPELLTGPRRTIAPAPAPEAEPSVEGAPLRSYTIELGERSSTKPAQPRNHSARNAPAPSQAAPAVPEPAVPERDASAKEHASPPAPAVAAPAADSPPKTGWSIQVGSFEHRENAERLTKELQRLGYRSFVTEKVSNAGKLYRVRVGPEADRASAQAMADRLRADDRLEPDIRKGSIVPHP